MEVLKQFGIDVVIVEPDGIKTNFGDVAAEKLEKAAKGGAYEEVSFNSAKAMRKNYDGNLLSDPIIISKSILNTINSKRPKKRYLIGFMAKPFVFLHTILPTRLFNFIMKNANR